MSRIQCLPDRVAIVAVYGLLGIRPIEQELCRVRFVASGVNSVRFTSSETRRCLFRQIEQGSSGSRSSSASSEF